MYPQNFEEACTSTGENPNDEKFTSGTADEVGYKKLKVVTKAINKVDNDGKDWEANWDDRDEEKWQAWWDMEIDKNNPSGFRFDDTDYDLTAANSPSRLCYKSKDGLRHSAEKFLPEWKAFISQRN
jgi:hypothetical protein